MSREDPCSVRLYTLSDHDHNNMIPRRKALDLQTTSFLVIAIHLEEIPSPQYSSSLLPYDTWSSLGCINGMANST